VYVFSGHSVTIEFFNQECAELITPYVTDQGDCLLQPGAEDGEVGGAATEVLAEAVSEYLRTKF